jgi:hypothetical protein
MSTIKAATLVLGLFVIAASPIWLQAQTQTCPAPNKLICVIPLLYDPSGNKVGVNLPNQAHSAHFDSDFQANVAAALNSSVGTELTSLRLASPTSGITFVFEGGVLRRSTESYGPILGERAETIGRHRVFVAGTYQYFPFSTLDGIDLKRLPAVYNHADTVNPNGTHRNPATDPPSPGVPGVELEYIRTNNRVDLKVHQFTFYATYGLTNRIDVSVAIPILNVRLGVTSDATIVRTLDTVPQGAALKAAWEMNPNIYPGNLYPGTGPMEGCQNTPAGCTGYFHYFDPMNPATSLTARFPNAKTASGIGDVLFRAKGTVFKRERTAVAFGTDVRVPTGDENNFLGAGAAGVKPFLSASYHARLSPHANIGYEFNGSSILAGNPVTKTKGRLPDQLFYSAGVDAGLTHKLTVAVDLLGQRFYEAPGMKIGPWEDVNNKFHSDIPQISQIHHSFNTDDLALGAKYSPFGNWLVTGNVQIKLDDGGLRAKVVPLIGVSYTF